MLRKGEYSAWHRVDAAEVWHWYAGSPLELRQSDGEDALATHVLGARLQNGERPQIVIPPHVWQSARTLGDFTLVGCTVAPAFEFSKFELADPELSRKLG
jgi:predicted cupin superfamily sugar epimerase